MALLKRRFARIAFLLGTLGALVAAIGADYKWH